MTIQRLFIIFPRESAVQRQKRGAVGEGLKRQRGEAGAEFVIDEVNFILVPLTARRVSARFEFFTCAESDVADEKTAVLLQKRQERAKKVDFLRVRQVVERVGRDNGVVLPRAKLGYEPFGKITLIESLASGILPCTSSIMRAEKSCP